VEVKQLGQTITQDGEVMLVVETIPPDCMVLFVSMEEWAKIKDSVKVV